MEKLVATIKVLGNGFVRMEYMKMEMAMETLRMEMEMKRTEMFLESQQRIVEAFAKVLSEKKKRLVGTGGGLGLMESQVEFDMGWTGMLPLHEIALRNIPYAKWGARCGG